MLKALAFPESGVLYFMVSKIDPCCRLERRVSPQKRDDPYGNVSTLLFEKVTFPQLIEIW